MGTYYYYSDKPKTDMKQILENENNNPDMNVLKDIIKKSEEKNLNNQNQDIKIESSFKLLKIEKIYLGFNSAYEIYEKYKKDFKRKNLMKRDASHPSLYFDFTEVGYYVDYLPDKGNSKNAKFIYKNSYGLRYCEKTRKEFIAHNDTCIIFLKSNENLSFYDYFNKICEKEKWNKEAHDYEKHNCNHFILKSLELLNINFENDANYVKNFCFTKEIEMDKRDAINKYIPSIFHSILKINY